jgi:NADH dehydrogenase FAD-containing subunit
VAVVGGGYGGASVAKALDDVADVVLIEPRDELGVVLLLGTSLAETFVPGLCCSGSRNRGQTGGEPAGGTPAGARDARTSA